MIETTESFTLQGYRSLIMEFFKLNYSIVNFSDMDPLRAHLILRHDIDMSLEAALPIAEIEQDLGIKASYFVLLRSELYNPLSPIGIKILKKLGDLGHEVGLHFDASLYSPSISCLNSEVKRECELLEMALGEEVKTVSFHRPSSKQLKITEPLAGRIHTYQPEFFSDIGYCSDSRGGWYHGHPLEHPSVISLKAIQLLIHPIWWNLKKKLGPVEVLDDFREKRDKLVAKTLSANCDPYRNERGANPESLKGQNK